MFLRTKNQRGLRRGLGTVSTPVAGTIVFGSNPISRVWGGNPLRSGPFPVSSPTRPPGYLGPINVRPVGPAYPVSPIANPTQPAPWTPPWQSGGYGGGGNGYSSPWSAAGSPYGSQPSSNSLATAQALLASNPSLLTPQQWSQLQAAGLVAGTLPYSSAGLVTTTAGTSVDSSAIDPATGIPYATELAAAQAGTSSTDIGTTLSETVLGLPLYLWLVIGGGAVLLMSRSGGRR
jgi:hypothetical protein